MGRTNSRRKALPLGLTRLEDLGLVVSTTHERGKAKTYYIPDPPTCLSA